ncbi:hypothetical protein P4679_28990 [Priestia megaterium]|uniref:hypothetical protein n=1 Tax=Priestia megaterium TaxID=1404 RepID=UPI002E1F51C7|nr:hypothetical protein [Priestia megaterium]
MIGYESLVTPLSISAQDFALSSTHQLEATKEIKPTVYHYHEKIRTGLILHQES